MHRKPAAALLFLASACIYGENPLFAQSSTESTSSGNTAGSAGDSTSVATGTSSATSARSSSGASTSSSDASSSDATSSDAETGNPIECPGVDIETDPDNCGGCGLRCYDGPCTAGACNVYLVADAQDDPFGIAADETHIYWSNRGSTEIMRADKVGGAPEVLAVANDDFDYLPQFVDLTPDFVLASVPNAGSSMTQMGSPIVTVPKRGGLPGALGYPVSDGVASLHAAGPFVYLAHRTGGAVRRAFLSGVLTEPVTQEAPGVRDVTLLGDTLYFCGDDGVARVSTDGGEVELLAPEEVEQGRMLDTDGSRIFVTTSTGLVAIDPESQEVVVFANAQIGTMGVGVDDTRVYWVGSGTGATGGVLYEADKNDPTSTTARVTALPVAYLLAHDDTDVYWTNRGSRPQTGVVLRVRK